MLAFELVVPAFNEARNLPVMLERTAAAAEAFGLDPSQFKLVVVENGSKDDSALVLRQLQASPLGAWLRVVHVEVNRGYGFGLKAGLATVTAAVVGWTHADLQCDPADVFKSFDALRSEAEPTVVKGRRTGRNWKDWMVSRAFDGCASLALGLWTHDINAQPKVFRRALLEELEGAPDTFGFDLFALYRARKAGFRLRGIPVSFPPRIHGVSNWANGLRSRYRTILGLFIYMIRLAVSEGRLRLSAAMWLFGLGLAARLAALPFFGSSYTKDLFIPFLDGAVQNPGVNPWTMFSSAHFPYGSFLFLVLYVPRQLAFWLLGPSVLTTPWLSMALCKAPLLVFDLLLLRSLARRTPNSRSIVFLYWLNPVLFFVTYVHGQLDLVVTACAFFAATLLVERRIKASALLMGLALTSKFHVALAVPFFVAYLWSREFLPRSFRQISAFLGIFSAVALLGLAPVIAAGKLGYTSVGSPEAMRLFAAQLDFGSGSVLYIGLAVVLAAVGRLCISTSITPRALLYGTGLLFGLLCFVTNAMPGWYFWGAPYVALLYANHRNAPRVPWYAFQAVYLVNFLLLPALDLASVGTAVQVRGIVFTVLQTTHASLLAILWIVAIKEEARLDRYMTPLMIGIAGDSGTGKNRLSAALCDVFEAKQTVLIDGDDYHKWERGDVRYLRHSHLSPKANDLQSLEAHAEQLMFGRMVFQPHYDHRSGRFSRLRGIQTRQTVVVQGLHALYHRKLREKFDLKIFLAPHELVRLGWKLKRDVEERGHSQERVLRALDERRADSLSHIDPQRRYADWIIETEPQGTPTQESVLAGKVPETFVRHTLWNDSALIALVELLEGRDGCHVTLERTESDFDRVTMTIAGALSAVAVADVAERLFPDLRQLTRGLRAPVWRSGQDGVAQLVALTLLSARNRLRGQEEKNFGDHPPSDQSDRGPRLGRPTARRGAGPPLDVDKPVSLDRGA